MVNENYLNNPVQGMSKCLSVKVYKNPFTEMINNQIT